MEITFCRSQYETFKVKGETVKDCLTQYYADNLSPTTAERSDEIYYIDNKFCGEILYPNMSEAELDDLEDFARSD